MKLKCIKDISYETLVVGSGDYIGMRSFYKGGIYEVTKFVGHDAIRGGTRQFYTFIDTLKSKCENFEDYFIEVYE